MKIRLELLGPLKLPQRGRAIERNYLSGTSVRRILEKELAYTPKRMKFLQIFHNGQSIHLDSKLSADATVQVVLRMGGG
jgi:hypothetical protein